LTPVVYQYPFHQLFMSSFFAQNYFSEIFCVNCLVCIFSQRLIGAKSAYKMLVKLTTGVNFTNILWGAFLYLSIFQSFSVLTVLVCIFSQKLIGAKSARNMLDISTTTLKVITVACIRVGLRLIYFKFFVYARYD